MGYPGIDYSRGLANIDKANGIRYGVINQHEVLQAWADSSEAYYGEPHCPNCGTELKDDHADGEKCPHCNHEISFVGEECFPEEAVSFFFDDEEYKAECHQDGDIFVMKSPYYTLCQFCSPCAPGAGYLMNHMDEGVKSYCFGHDWFEGGKAPYPVYRVDTGELVKPENAQSVDDKKES